MVANIHIVYQFLNHINILLDVMFRFFNSKVKTNSSEDSSCSKKLAAREVTSFETLV